MGIALHPCAAQGVLLLFQQHDFPSALSPLLLCLFAKPRVAVRV